MKMMRRRLACCSHDRGISLDFDEREGIRTYNGLESFILNSNSYENESGISRGDECVTDSFDEDASSSSCSTNAFGSFSSHWMPTKRDHEQGVEDRDTAESPFNSYAKRKPAHGGHFLEVETMKEKFAKLLLGEDITGGRKGVSTALALSNAITSLSASVFGELWKLEPLSEDRKSKWGREMEWLLSPTNYMVELVPAKQNGANGHTLEIMTPKARADVHINLPALQKLDSMLIETLDSMVGTEFWYEERGSRDEGKNGIPRQSRKWWLPLPQVPNGGLSDIERQKLLNKGKVVHQVFKAAKSINETVLLEMSVPTMIKDALPKYAKVSLGEDLYKILNEESMSAEEKLDSLHLKSEHNALETINRVEAAILAWRERFAEQASGKSPVRTSWSFVKDPLSELDKMEFLLDQAQALIQNLKTRYPDLPRSFLDVVKVQYGKDVGHSILEAYSRVLKNLALRMLARMGDILQEDVFSNPSSPLPNSCIPGFNIARNPGSPFVSERFRHSLIDQMNKVAGEFGNPHVNSASDFGNKSLSATATPSRSRVRCMGSEASQCSP